MLKGFISYSHKDTEFCNELQNWLIPAFKRDGIAEFWSDKAIEPGDKWRQEIMAALDTADVALFLVSNDLYASEFVWDVELPRAADRERDGQLTIIPIHLRTCYHKGSERYRSLSDAQAVPHDDKGQLIPLTKFQDRDDGYTRIISAIGRKLERLKEQRAAGVQNSYEVDSALAELQVALAATEKALMQAPDDGSVPVADITAALRTVQTVSKADTIGLRDNASAAYQRLRRIKFSRDDHTLTHTALAALRDALVAIDEAAREAAYPTHGSASIAPPAPRLVPQGEIAAARAQIELRVVDLEVRLSELEGSRQGKPETAAVDAAIDQVVEEAGAQTSLARGLLLENQVDIGGVVSAISGAARNVGRFVARVGGIASKVVLRFATGLSEAASALVAAGQKLEPATEIGVPIVIRNGPADETIHRVPGATVAFQDRFLVKGKLVEGPRMLVVPGGRFWMGSRAGLGREREHPQRRVAFSRPFAIGESAVTRAQFAEFVSHSGTKISSGAFGWDGSEFEHIAGYSWRNCGFAQQDDHPVVCVNWFDAMNYVQWLSQVAMKGYRLPTEAEWEYCCRAGTETEYAFGDKLQSGRANFGRLLNGTTPCGNYPPNQWGIFDMHGNTWDWVMDGYHEDYTGRPPVDGSEWIEAADLTRRIMRGGSWDNNPALLRSAHRDRYPPGDRFTTAGFRVVRDI